MSPVVFLHPICGCKLLKSEALLELLFNLTSHHIEGQGLLKRTPFSVEDSFLGGCRWLRISFRLYIFYFLMRWFLLCSCADN